MQPHKKLIHNDIEVTHEFIPSNVFENYNRIYEAIERQFLTDRSFACISNSFYTNFNGQMVNWGKIDESCKTFLREIFTPNDEMRSYIQYILNSIHIGNDSYNVIHLRFGDAYIHDGSFDDEKLNTIHNKIQPILQDGSKYILLTDSETMTFSNQMTAPARLVTIAPVILYYFYSSANGQSVAWCGTLAGSAACIDMYGGPLWADMDDTIGNPLTNYHQIVGHTATQDIIHKGMNDETSITYIDCLNYKVGKFYEITITT
jgi:hypothetical protein